MLFNKKKNNNIKRKKVVGKKTIDNSSTQVHNIFEKDKYGKTAVFGSVKPQKTISKTDETTFDTIKMDMSETKFFKKNGKKKKLTRKQLMSRIAKISAIVLAAFLLIGVIGFGIFTFIVYTYQDPELDQVFGDIKLDFTTTIYAKDKSGEYVEIEQLYKDENRVWVDSANIPDHMKWAVVCIEDERFFTHSGVDWKRFTSAFLNYFIPFKAGAGGGSTITQQLIKNLTGDMDVSATRKAKEVLRALYIERKYSKDQILEYYMNKVYFGNSCNGVQSAAHFYFGKDVSELTIAESACIAGITNLPVTYDPIINPENNKSRQLIILAKMHELKKITDEEYEAAKVEELVFKKSASSATSSKQTYFVDQLINEVVADFIEKDYDETTAINTVYTRGLKIYATVDSEIQNIMDEAFMDDKNFDDGNLKDEKPECAMYMMNPTNGEVVALRGGRGVKQENRGLNRAVQSKRQPGSSIKPIAVYGPAIENGTITLGSVYDDNPIQTLNGKPWPINAYGEYTGKMTMQKAVERSANTVAVRVLNDLGIDKSLSFLTEKLHMTTFVTKAKDGKDDRNLSLGIGGLTYGVTVEEMTAAFNAFNNKGIYVEPHTYVKVTSHDGKTLLEKRPVSNIAVSEETAYLTQQLMIAAVENGTAASYGNLGSVKYAGKTGTTSDDKDRWFVGYTPYYTAGAWCGYDEPKPLDDNGVSGNPALKIWKIVMNKVNKAKKLNSGNFSAAPSNIISASFCIDSGMAPGPYCVIDPRGPRVTTALFVKGTEPTQICTFHQNPTVSSVSESSSSSSSSSSSKSKSSASSSKSSSGSGSLSSSDSSSQSQSSS